MPASTCRILIRVLAGAISSSLPGREIIPCATNQAHSGSVLNCAGTLIMLLPREFVTYLSRQIVRRLTPATIETPAPERVAELIDHVVSEELAAEDKLNDEVRDLLDQYSDYMRREGVSYQDMFRKIKNTMVQQRKIVRASGRDTGDSMKLSRDKVTDISHKLITAMRKSRDLRIKNKNDNDARL